MSRPATISPTTSGAWSLRAMIPNAFATNRKRLETLSDKELAEFIEKKIINDPQAKRIDILKWLKSSDQETIYKQ